MAAQLPATPPTFTYSLIADYPRDRLTPRQCPPKERVSDRAAESRLVEYTSQLLPPADWLTHRHRDTPAVFRDSFSHSHWWSDEQRAVIRRYFANWNTDTTHSIRQLAGYCTSTQPNSTPANHADYPNHYVSYYLNHLHSRSSHPTATGLILYGAFLPPHAPITVALRNGPAGLHIHANDSIHLSNSNSTLNVIVGMQHMQTKVHVDTGSECVWHLLLEGQKLWLISRRENEAAMRAAFPDSARHRWQRWTAETRKWVSDTRSILVVQDAGDIVYLPADWPHAVKHLTDTLALQATAIQPWDVERSLMDFNIEEGDIARLRGTYEYAIEHAAQLGVSNESQQRMRAKLTELLARMQP